MKQQNNINTANLHQEWENLVQDQLTGKTFNDLMCHTDEGIDIKAMYSKDDLSDLDDLDALPGMPPFIRGPYATMYAGRPWTIRQYAGFSTAEKSNEFYRHNLDSGGQGISVAFDLPTHRGYDSDNERAKGDVGKAGVAVDSVEDMKILFQGIPLDKVSVSMTMNGAILPVFACYIVAAEEQGVDLRNLSGTNQNDILKEFLVRNTYIYPPSPSMKIVGDIINYCCKNMPQFKPISISGYHIKEAGADASLELAYTLANGREYVRTALATGLTIDEVAPNLSFFFGVGMNFYIEVAKLRAARLLWAEIIDEFNPRDVNSKILKTHCQTSGWSLTVQDPYNNVVRTTIEAMAAIFGGTQSLHTNSLDEAVALPSDFSSRIARNTQLILQEESDITKVVDPWGGSYFMEKLTRDLAERAREIIEETTKNGGILASIENGSLKKRIQCAAAKKQAKIDSGEHVIVGLNKHKNQIEKGLETLEVDSNTVLKSQLSRLHTIRKNRSSKKVEETLTALTQAAKDGNKNLLGLTVDAIRARATVGEVTSAIEKVYGRFAPQSSIVSGIYKNTVKKNKEWEIILEKVKLFRKERACQPRMLVAKIGQDGHDRGANVIASAFADIGFDISLCPLFSSPVEIVQLGIKNDVHVIGISSLAGGHKILVPDLIQELKNLDREDILVVVGGVIPESDFDFLNRFGVSCIFGPGTPVQESANKILESLEQHPREMLAYSKRGNPKAV